MMSSILNSGVFPGMQGGPLEHVIAAKAVCLGEAMRPEFRTWAHNVVDNARTLSEVLLDRGIGIVSGGTDNHLMLADVAPAGLTGDQAEKVIEHAGLTCNKNALPGDPVSIKKWRGVRLGVSAATTRGMGEAEMAQIGNVLADIWFSADGYEPDPEVIAKAQQTVSALTAAFPTYNL